MPSTRQVGTCEATPPSSSRVRAPHLRASSDDDRVDDTQDFRPGFSGVAARCGLSPPDAQGWTTFHDDVPLVSHTTQHSWPDKGAVRPVD